MLSPPLEDLEKEMKSVLESISDHLHMDLDFLENKTQLKVNSGFDDFVMLGNHARTRKPWPCASSPSYGTSLQWWLASGQTMERDEWVVEEEEVDTEADATWHGDIAGQRQGSGPTSVEVNKVKKGS
ncbi:hypothetical protein NC651_038913 [Populus alba x Populus x berolinensis]|nr:hypothetical protein NC651_038913 [Populus alba x Populus x berolinensis]